MKYISLNNNSLTVFTSKGTLSELSGSSKYLIIDNELVKKKKSGNGKIENRCAKLEMLHQFNNAKMSQKIFNRLCIRYAELWQEKKECTQKNEILNLQVYSVGKLVLKAIRTNPDFLIKSAIINKTISEQNSKYKTTLRKKSDEKKINKSKVKGKMYALFNLKCSQKFMAFFSVSFPISSSDDNCFECWNAWLTCLRKRFSLTNYVWVTERQKNGTLHFHMLTNNYMPILQINRAMAIIINNKVLDKKMSWNGSSLDKYNGVDVDSIFNSKRHKKSGKILNPSEVRNWIAKYITKYVTKNNEKFLHLCWHCSRSVSILFTSTIIDFIDRLQITNYLPSDKRLYLQFKSDFNHTCVFKFVPYDKLFEKIRAYNDWIFEHYEPEKYLSKNNINYKTTTL